MSDFLDFTNKTAVITGGASGMGLLTGQELAARGANVVLLDIDEGTLKTRVDEINAKGQGKAIGIKTDLRIYQDIKQAMETTVRTFGTLDILVNCAGGASCRIIGYNGGSFKDGDPETLSWCLDVNLRGAMWCCHAAIPYMFAQNSGVMIMMGSIDGVTGCYGCPDYSAAKGGIFSFTKSMALYCASHNVRACCVTPGPILTRPGMSNMRTPMLRAGEPIEVVNLILFLVSDKASFITGTNYLVDGGRSCGAQDYGTFPKPE